MLEKPKRVKQLNNQDRQLPATIQELINRYDLENKYIYKFLDYLVDNINKTNTGEGSVTGDTLPIGAIIEWNSDIIPENWLLCNGQEVSRTDYAELFKILGTAYGEGDGSTTFNLPNYKGRVAVGKDSSDSGFDTLGKTGGEKTHTLTVAEMPSHSHNFSEMGRVLYWDAGLPDMGGLQNGTGVQYTWSSSTKATGGSQPHNNLQPYMVVNFIVKAKQSSGLVATVVDNLNSNSPTDGLSAKQGKILNEKISGAILYDNSVGENETIILSDSVANYRELRVDYKMLTNNYASKDSIRIFITDGDCFSLSSVVTHSDVLQLIASARYLASGNTITKQHEIRSRIDTSGGVASDGNKATILITQVIGYKY